MSVFNQIPKSKPSGSSSFNSRKGEDFFGVQAKLTIGKPNDKYEAEADKVADTVVSDKKNGPPEPFFAASPVVLNKKANDLQKRSNQEKEIQNQTTVGEITPVVQLKTEKEESLQTKSESSKPQEKIINSKSLVQPKKEEIQAKEEEEIQTKEDEKELQMSPAAAANPSDGPNIESKLNSSKGGGSPLSGKIKTEMESGIGADFSNVRIHNDANAVQMNKQLGAQAFATGNNIYFNEGKYNPNSHDGRHLLAHELTHTVQQGAAIRKKTEDNISPAPEMIQGSFLDYFPDWIINEARHIPGYTLFTVIIGYDPLRQADVERTPINLIEGLMGLVPFGTAIFDKLQEYGILQQVFDWVEGKLSELGLTIDSILNLVEEIWDKVEFPYTDIIDLVAQKFNEVVNRITSFVSATVDQVITWIKEALIGVAEPILAENKAWSLIKKIIKYDPLRDEAVNATTVEILEDFLILIDKQTELEQMREKGTLQKTADWLDTQVGTFTSLLGELRGLITAAWDAIHPSNLANIADNLSALAAQTGEFLQRVWDFASGVALKVLELVKESLLGWLSSQAATVRGYSLVKVIIGKDPFTQEAVPRTIPNLIRGFMSLMDGGEEQYAQMAETGAIARIAGQIEAAVATLNMTPESIVQLFTDIWNTITIDDLIHPIDAFMRIIEKFGEPIGRLIAFVAEIIRIVIVAILEIMNFPFDLIGNIITRALEAIDDIKKDPIGFLKNILRALKQGFVQFFDNIVTHLINGVTGWLMSELKDANIPVLTDFSLQGVITWVMEVLNISMEKIWEKLAAHPRIGPARVAKIRSMINTLEGIWTFIKDVQERGMAAIWDKIQEQLSNLWNTVLDAVKNFVMERIVNRITARLLSMLDPTGIMAVINGAIAFFNAIQSFIKYLREMLEVVNSFVNGVADLARGNVATAADYLERTMGQAMPVVIGFLANQVGLTGIGARIGEMIISVQQMVDEALTWLVNKAVDTGMALLDRVMAMGASVRDAILDWLGLRKQFNADGETHNLFLRAVGGVPQMWVASEEMPFSTFLTNKQTEINEITNATTKARKQGALNSATAIYNNDIVRIKNLLTTETDQSRKTDLQNQLNAKFNEIVPFLVITGIANGGRLPDTHVQIGGSGGRASFSEADPLTKNESKKPPRVTAEPAGWASHIKTINNYDDIYVRLHLLHFDLGGPGNDTGNVTPGKKSENGMMYNQAEQNAVNLVHSENRVLWYRAEVTSYRSEVGFTDFAEGIRVSYGFKEKNDSGEWVRVGGVLYNNVFPVSKPDPLGSSSTIPSINDVPARYWDLELKNIPNAPSRTIFRDWVNSRGAENYNTWTDFTNSNAFKTANASYGGTLETWFRSAVASNKLIGF
ncbi:eCIS core domain-containing protein [Flavobacterium fluviatile]|uniref:eCIS core domain-containing protein n=1 Tax=Flavobacterium fluviatile TaxID=1862387 RepID=UPI0013D5D7DD|nr:DUF4157 domain-containing protein [Flavobacterium fluviatile]